MAFVVPGKDSKLGVVLEGFGDCHGFGYGYGMREEMPNGVITGTRVYRRPVDEIVMPITRCYFEANT